jgi:hypothetical protein
MAKPGQQAKAAMAKAVDLSRARMSDERVLEVQGTLEMAQGLRCNGCGRRITTGFHFTSLAPREDAVAMRLAACAREDCDYAMRCREGGTYMEVVEYVWLDGLGPEAPPTKAFVEAQAKQAAKANGRESRAEQTD